jgi:hypothetical protein
MGRLILGEGDAHLNAPLYSLRQLAEITNESVAAWRKRILLKQISYIKCGRNVRVSKATLLLWLSRRIVSR